MEGCLTRNADEPMVFQLPDAFDELDAKLLSYGSGEQRFRGPQFKGIVLVRVVCPDVRPRRGGLGMGGRAQEEQGKQIALARSHRG